MKKTIKRRYMTRFDYNVRKFSFLVVILFILSLAFLTPALDTLVTKSGELTKKITLLEVENDVLKQQQEMVVELLK